MSLNNLSIRLQVLIPLLLASLLMLGACASPLPAVDPNMAWVDLKGEGIDLLMAERLDRKRVNDGRYFQVTPGAHELEMRFSFEISGGGGASLMSEPQQLIWALSSSARGVCRTIQPPNSAEPQRTPLPSSAAGSTR